MISKGFFIRKVFIQSAPPPPRLKRLFAVFGFSAEGAFSFLTTGQKKFSFPNRSKGQKSWSGLLIIVFCLNPSFIRVGKKPGDPLLWAGFFQTKPA